MTDSKRLEYLRMIEAHGAENGWVEPLDKTDLRYLVHFREVCKRYNINPSKATRLEYDFVTRVTDEELNPVME